MGTQNKHGFTIIEVMLFLAITGVLTVAILVGAGTSISQQRYRDSVNSLSNLLQQQYSEVTTVRNDRDANWVCDSSSGPVEAPAGGVSRGTTDCVVIGKYLSLEDKKLTVQTIVGRVSTGSEGDDDIAALLAANLTLSDIDKQEHVVEWGAAMQDIDKTPIATTMMIVRSPTTGSIRTFIDQEDGATQSPVAMVTTENLSTNGYICVESDGLFSGKRFGVELIANASSPTGIKMHGDGTSQC